MKVCIVGTAPGSRLIAPYKDESYEIWVCSAGNSQAQAVPRITKWYELHAVHDMMAVENQGWCAPYFGWLRSQSFPIYMQEINEFIPQAIVFPMKRMVERFGPNPKKGLANWFTSSVAYMLAHAIDQMRPSDEYSENGDEIAIFGVDMAATEEHYSAQKAGCHRFIEIARSLGIKVIIPYESCLGKTFPMYGYAEATPMGRKLAVRELEIKNFKTTFDNQIRSLELQRAFFEGALESVRYDQRTWVDGFDAELDTGEKEQGEAVAMRSQLEKSHNYRTANFEDNGNGVFVPRGTPPSSQLPEGSTVHVDTSGKKHYGMECDPAVFGDPTANTPEIIESENTMTIDVPKVTKPRRKRGNSAHAEA